MVADASAALPTFLSKLGDEGARRYLESNLEQIINVFKDSGLHNLRILQQAMWDFERLWLALTTSQRAHKDAMLELTVLLCASAFELLSGRTKPTSFRRNDMVHFMRARREERDEDTIAAENLFNRYPSVKFEGSILAPETMREVVLDAAFPMKAVQDQLQNHPIFLEPQDVPSWRALWESFNLDADEVTAVLTQFRQDFDSRAFKDEGEILHVVGLCLWLSDIGQPGWDAGDLIPRLESYVDDVYAARTPSTSVEKASSLSRLAGGSYNLGFRNADDPRFLQISSRVDKAANALRKRGYPEVAGWLQQTMIEDSETFMREVCFTSAGPARYARWGVLSHIPASEFAATFAKARRKDQDNIAIALSRRYDQAPAEEELQAELPWLRTVAQGLLTLADSMDPIPKHFLKGLVERYMMKHVSQTSDGPASEGSVAEQKA